MSPNWGARDAIHRYEAGRTPGEPTSGLSHKSVHSVKIMLKSAFADAVVWRYLQTNPTVGVRGPSVKRRSHHTWSPEQLAKFLSSVRHERLYAMWILVATTGMRRSEIAGLPLDHLDLDNNALYVKKTRVVTGGKVHEGEGKSHKSRRRLPLDRATAAMLQQHAAVIEEEKTAWGDHYQDHGSDPVADSLRRSDVPADNDGDHALADRATNHSAEAWDDRRKCHVLVNGGWWRNRRVIDVRGDDGM